MTVSVFAAYQAGVSRPAAPLRSHVGFRQRVVSAGDPPWRLRFSWLRITGRWAGLGV